MTEAKSEPTQVPIAQTIAAIDDLERRADCDTLLQLMRKVTGLDPVMSGTSTVGFGKYWYGCRYEGGRSGESCVTGFAPRNGEISVYMAAEGSSRTGCELVREGTDWARHAS
jgi:hypothetical protein